MEKEYSLGAEIDNILRNTDGVWGIYVRDLESGDVLYERNSGDVFPSASIGKLPIALSVLAEVDAGFLKLTDSIEFNSDVKLGGSGVIKYLHEGLSLTVQDLLYLMLVVSDNSAAKMFVRKLTPERINLHMDSFGFNITKIKIDGDKFGYGMTTPIEIGDLLSGVYKHDFLSENSSSLFLEILSKHNKPERIIRYLPEKLPNGEELLVYSKGGSIPGVRSDVGIVKTEKPYVISILSKDITDDSYRPDNAGVLAIAQISKIIFDRS